MIKIVRNESRDRQVYRCTDRLSSEKKYFIKVIKIFSSAFIDEEFHLTNREFDLLYGIYQSISIGERDVLKSEIIEKFFKSFKDKKTIQVWLSRVQKKGWVTEYNGFYYIEGEFEKLMQFNITGFTIDLINNEAD